MQMLCTWEGEGGLLPLLLLPLGRNKPLAHSLPSQQAPAKTQTGWEGGAPKNLAARGYKRSSQQEVLLPPHVRWF